MVVRIKSEVPQGTAGVLPENRLCTRNHTTAFCMSLRTSAHTCGNVGNPISIASAPCHPLLYDLRYDFFG